MDELRRARLATRIVRELSTLVQTGMVKDPRVDRLIGFSYCVVAKDGSTARLGVSSYRGLAAAERATLGLRSAAGYLQARVAKVLHTRLTPKLRFVADDSIGLAQRTLHTLSELGEHHDDATPVDSAERDSPAS